MYRPSKISMSQEEQAPGKSNRQMSGPEKGINWPGTCKKVRWKSAGHDSGRPVAVARPETPLREEWRFVHFGDSAYAYSERAADPACDNTPIISGLLGASKCYSIPQKPHLPVGTLRCSIGVAYQSG